MADNPDMPARPDEAADHTDGLAGRLASWLEGLGLADQLDAAGLPTYERGADGVDADVPGHRFYTIRDASRSQKLAFFLLILEAFWLLMWERPAVIVTTGAAPGLVVLALGKTIFRSKTIWIDSVANVEKLSGSGKLAARFADVRLAQWPDLATGDIEHWGAVL